MLSPDAESVQPIAKTDAKINIGVIWLIIAGHMFKENYRASQTNELF